MANTRSWLDNLKLRYSYGEVGNDRLAGDTRFPYISVVDGEGGYNFGEIGQTGVGGVAIKTIGTPNLTWETATKHNIGVDIGLFSKFTLTVDMFKDTRKNIFMKRDHIPGTVGLSGGQIPWANVGKMENMGFDGTMAYSDKIGDVSYTLRGNITYSNTNVIDYDEAANELNYKMTKGYRWSQTRGLIALGLFKDEADIENSPVHSFGPVKPGDIKYKDVNGDGVVNDDDVVPIGYTHNPGLIYGMGLSVEWKGFDFSVLFQGAGSCDFFVGGWGVYPFQEGEAGNIMKVASNPADRWISREISGTPDTENPNAIFPRLTYGNSQNNNRASTHWLRNGRYLRLKNLTIGYTIPKKISRKLLMEGARIYFLGNNLAVWDSFGWWDPELASDNGARYPIQKNFTLGLTLNF
nr:SusC/RagA family TonB-linked outer membrane protein [Bacteroides thetaiotaomicron]